MSEQPRTLRELRESGYRSVSIKDEMRRNLINRLRSKQTLFPGILGYDETVFPQVVNAILSRHDMLFLGLRGQGKTRMLRMLTSFLDEEIPIIEGSEINDDPFAPVSHYGKETVARLGEDTPVSWIGRDQRYHEKLATPDVTIADLIGEVDLIKHAEGRRLSSEDVMHFGLIPRSHRSIFAMNELPDLAPRIQVGLFNVLEERDVQIRGFTVRLPLDVCMVFSANPEDYTNRGRIVTPLKDRIGSVIRTHYPVSRELGMEITRETAWRDRDSGVDVIVPAYLEAIIEETSRLARTSPHVNQASGVSVRMSVANFENVVSNAERRALLEGADQAVARISDLAMIVPSSRGKIELSMSEESGDEDRLIERLAEEAIKNVFDQVASLKQFQSLVQYFDTGKRLTLTRGASSREIVAQMDAVPGFSTQLEALASSLTPELANGPAAVDVRAGLIEFVLDGMYAHNRLNRKRTDQGAVYGL